MSPSVRVDENFIANAARALEDPALFTSAFLHNNLWSKQEAILKSVASHPQTAVKACHASGKTFVAAQCVLWWLARYSNGIAITTAPTWTQVERLLWGDIKAAVKGSSWPFPEPMKTEIRISENNYAIGLSTDEGNRFQGFHGQILIVVDEAPGVRPSIFEAISGIQAGGDVRLLFLGNPTLPSGRFFDAFASPTWATFTIDAFETPNLEGVPGATHEQREAYLANMSPDWSRLTAAQREFLMETKRPYLVTRRWVWEKLHDWGDTSPIYQSRVRGRFPVEADDSLFSFAWIERARDIDETETGDFEEVEAAVDVAGPGDDETVLFIRQGSNVKAMHTWHIPDPKQAIINALAPYKKRNIVVKVDAVGIGFHVWKAIKDAGFDARPLVAHGKAREPDRFANFKAEAYWAVREALKSGDVHGLTDETTIAQLLSIRYDHDEKGRVVIESKRAARRRGVKSPDRADAFIMAFAPLSAPPLRCY